MTTKEAQIEENLINKLTALKYVYRKDIRDKAALEQNFRQKFNALNRVTLTDLEFDRLKEEIISPDVFATSNKLIVETYQFRKEEERFSRRVPFKEIKKNEFNLNISRYISTAEPEPIIDLKAVNDNLVEIEKRIKESTEKHNAFLKELGLDLI